MGLAVGVLVLGVVWSAGVVGLRVCDHSCLQYMVPPRLRPHELKLVCRGAPGYGCALMAQAAASRMACCARVSSASHVRVIVDRVACMPLGSRCQPVRRTPQGIGTETARAAAHTCVCARARARVRARVCMHTLCRTQTSHGAAMMCVFVRCGANDPHHIEHSQSPASHRTHNN